MKGSAAGLARHIHYLDAETREDPCGRGVDVAVRDAHDASEEQRDAGDRSGRGGGGVVARPPERRVHRLETPEARGKEAERARPAEQRPQPGELVEREDAREHVEERGPREDPAQ